MHCLWDMNSARGASKKKKKAKCETLTEDMGSKRSPSLIYYFYFSFNKINKVKIIKFFLVHKLLYIYLPIHARRDLPKLKLLI